MTTQKPQLADDVNLDTLPYPVWGFPKIDGVRGLNTHGRLTGRSLDEFKGFGVTGLFTSDNTKGFDGELTLGSNPAADNLCSDTTGAVGAFKDVTEAPDLHWWLFDYVGAAQANLVYADRYKALEAFLSTADMGEMRERLHIIPYRVINNKVEAEAFISECLDANYEGAVFRNPRSKIKPGRPGINDQQYMRYKPWMDSEMLVTELVEGETNTNKAKVNTLGRTERSSAKAGKVPNGKVGAIIGTLLADIHHPLNGKLLFAKGLKVRVSKGKLKDPQAKRLWENPQEIVGHIIKFQHMAHGVQDLPRFGGYVSHRVAEDMSKE